MRLSFDSQHPSSSCLVLQFACTSSPLYIGEREREREREIRQMTASTALRIERKPSIETEPRTLSLAELRSAREEVMFILSTKSLEEAINIFTQGLQPVRSIRKEDMDLDAEDDEMLQSLSDYNLTEARDIVTAPF